MPTTERRIAHLEMDAFYVSVELLRYPQLARHPVAIGGGRRRGPMLIEDGRDFARLRNYVGRGAATYAARHLSVNLRMGLMKVAALAPDGIGPKASSSSKRSTSAPSARLRRRPWIGSSKKFGERHGRWLAQASIGHDERPVVVDYANLLAGQQDSLGIDKVRLGQNASAAIPEPRTWLLIGRALAAIVLRRYTD